MAATWKGAAGFAGFPINFALHTRTKSRSGDSFKTLAPNGEPIKQQYVDTDGNVVPRSDTHKGFERSPGDYVSLTPAQVDRIEKGGARSTLVEATSFAPLSSVPLDLATADYIVEPDEKIPGSAKSLNVLWNGLHKTKLAYITTITLRSRDSILAIYADDHGLYAAALPFASELQENVGIAAEPDAAQATMFEQTVEASYTVAPFDHSAYVSEYAARRERVIEEVLTGAPPAEEAKPPETGAAVDLMAALTAAQGSKPKAKRKPKATAKV